MIIENIPWQQLMFVCNAILITAVGLAAIGMRRDMRRNTAAVNTLLAGGAEALAYDDRDLRRMVDRRITMLEKFLELQAATQTREPADKAAPVAVPQKSELPVDYAVRMVRSGASVDDLVRGCGLNKGEAQLLMRLHSKTPTSAATTTH